MVSSVSRNAVLPQLSSSPETSLGTQVHQNSSPDWLSAKTSRYASSVFRGKVTLWLNWSAVVFKVKAPRLAVGSGTTSSATRGAGSRKSAG